MTSRHLILSVAALIAMLAVSVGCGSSDSAEPPETTTANPSPELTVGAGPEPTVGTTSQPAAATTPVGIIALGHSDLTGYNSNANRPGQDARDNSWATGTSPEVNSIYQRLVAVRPETEGHVANAAEDGAKSGILVRQAGGALKEVPAPALVIIEIVDNDIRCDGTDDVHVGEFGRNVATALRVITESSPDSRILMAGVRGRPATLAQAVAANPAARRSYTGTGMCDLFDPSGELNEEHVATLTAIIESYEAEQERVCAAVPQCSTDGGAFAGYQDSLDDLAGSIDWGHSNTHGLARAAEIMWPTVAALLKLS